MEAALCLADTTALSRLKLMGRWDLYASIRASTISETTVKKAPSAAPSVWRAASQRARLRPLLEAAQAVTRCRVPPPPCTIGFVAWKLRPGVHAYEFALAASTTFLRDARV